MDINWDLLKITFSSVIKLLAFLKINFKLELDYLKGNLKCKNRVNEHAQLNIGWSSLISADNWYSTNILCISTSHLLKYARLELVCPK